MKQQAVDVVDRIDYIRGAQVQHGPGNQRMYVMKPPFTAAPELPQQLQEEARRRGYSKIIAKIGRDHLDNFLEAGFVTEAEIPQYFRGAEPAFFAGYFLDPLRRDTPARDGERMAAVLAKASRKRPVRSVPLPKGMNCILADPTMVGSMAAFYRKVFATYPFPIHDPEYLEATMVDKAVMYYAVLGPSGEIEALASSELDHAAQAAEMTDFATSPESRGSGLAQFLLGQMEADMGKRGYCTAYTIARALSFGMNISFARRGYRWGGRLINNTNISGRLESMNVWYKKLQPLMVPAPDLVEA